MKYTIEGFSQKKLVEYKLDPVDALILRWFIDFRSTKKMVKISKAEGEFYWVKYDAIINDLPCIGINNKEVMARRFKKYVDLGLMIHHTEKNISGSYACYNTTELIESFMYDPTLQKVECNLLESLVQPARKSGATYSKVGPKDSSTNYYSTNNNSIKEIPKGIIANSDEFAPTHSQNKNKPPETEPEIQNTEQKQILPGKVKNLSISSPAPAETWYSEYVEHWNGKGKPLTVHKNTSAAYRDAAVMFMELEKGIFGQRHRDVSRDYLKGFNIPEENLHRKWSRDEIFAAIDMYFKNRKEYPAFQQIRWPKGCSEFIYNPVTKSLFIFTLLGVDARPYCPEVKDSEILSLYRRAFANRELNVSEHAELIRGVNTVIQRRKVYHDSIGKYFTPSVLIDDGFYHAHIRYLTEMFLDRERFKLSFIGDHYKWKDYILHSKKNGYDLDPTPQSIKSAEEEYERLSQIRKQQDVEEAKYTEAHEKWKQSRGKGNKWQILAAVEAANA
jgi:hypothetical protein